MGVPALFRWLSTKYPKITNKVIEDLPPTSVDERSYFGMFDFSRPNPNGFEVDNLYLDMNGIVHPCCHPEGREAPPTEDAMMQEVCLYIDRIMSMVRPRKLLYMAVDGVAPRAKMNQQRSRRFKSALDVKEQPKREGDEEGKEPTQAPFDSNCITPGTPFMQLLKNAIITYVQERIAQNPAWKNLYVIFSDSSVPGEGEHKIMNFIREQRESPHYNPNQTHVIYGLDADLIMLTLATHEPRFYVLREDVFLEEARRYNTCFVCNAKGHFSEDCPKTASLSVDQPVKSIVTDKPFIFLDIATLREYLKIEFFYDNIIPSKSDFERLLDDWVFMSFFIGNDFLPHLPSLDIREDAIDLMMKIYKRNFVKMGGYITKNGHVYLDRIQILIGELGQREGEIFTKRKEVHDRKEEAKRRREERERGSKELRKDNNRITESKSNEKANLANETEACISSSVPNKHTIDSEEQDAKRLPAEEGTPNDNKLEAQLLTLPSIEQNNTTSSISLNSSTSASEDEVRFWEPGAKDRYYEKKLRISTNSNEAVQEIVKCYVEGLCWVMAYYYQGCVSWKWFYPFHYAPMSSDFERISRLEVKFEDSAPFKAYEQLLGVLPAASKALIPQPFHWLMTDKSSQIHDFYPEAFPIDLNGKKFAWQGVVLLPFIDEVRLVAAAEQVYPTLCKEDSMRNEAGFDLLFMSIELAQRVTSSDSAFKVELSELDGKIEKIPSEANEQLIKSGFISQLQLENFESVACYAYFGLDFSKEHKFLSRLLPSCTIPKSILTEEDFPIESCNYSRNQQQSSKRPSDYHSRSYDRPRPKQY